MSELTRVQQRPFRSSADQAVVTLLVAAGVVLQRLNELCRKHGITHDQYNVLRILRGVHPEGHPRYEIANRLVSRAPDVTRLLDRLERQGLIERGWAQGNRRLSIARVSGAGLELLAAIDPELDAVQREIVVGVPEEDLRTFTAVCTQIAR